MIIYINVIAWSDLKAKMELYSLLCLLEGDKCRFQTQQLEFSKAKEILQMHMMLVHVRRYNCNFCDRDTCDNDNKDVIEDDKEALCNKDDEAYCDFLEEPSEIDDPTSVRKPTKQNEASTHPSIANVTSVRDDREQDCLHFEEDQVRQPLKQRTMLSRRYSSQLEFYYLLLHEKTVKKPITLLRGKSEETRPKVYKCDIKRSSLVMQ